MSVRALTRRFDRLRGDDGLTLPEVIIVSLVTTLLLIAVGGMYISTLRAERTISELAGTTNSAQLVARSIDTGVRNAIELDSIRTGADGGQMLTVCTVGADPAALSHSWRAWYYSPADGGEIRTRDFAANAKPPVPSATDLATWTLLLEGVTPRTGAGVFTVDEPNRTKASISFVAEGEKSETTSTTIEFTPVLAPRPTFAPGTEPCT